MAMSPEPSQEAEPAAPHGLTCDGASCGCPPSHRRLRRALLGVVYALLALLAGALAYLAWTSFG